MIAKIIDVEESQLFLTVVLDQPAEHFVRQFEGAHTWGNRLHFPKKKEFTSFAQIDVKIGDELDSEEGFYRTPREPRSPAKPKPRHSMLGTLLTLTLLASTTYPLDLGSTDEAEDDAE